MITGKKLSKNDESTKVNQTLYRSMIGKLKYVAHSISNITLSIRIITRFSINPKENHLMVVKRIMRYLKGTKEFGLYYKKKEKFDLKAYTNADWGGNINDKKSTSGGALFLGKRLVTWTSKKQSCTSQAVAKDEYVVAAINCTNMVWIKNLLKGMKEDIT